MLSSKAKYALRAILRLAEASSAPEDENVEVLGPNRQGARRSSPIRRNHVRRR